MAPDACFVEEDHNGEHMCRSRLPDKYIEDQAILVAKEVAVAVDLSAEIAECGGISDTGPTRRRC